MRQSAVNDDHEISCSPPRLNVRFLPTIPSAADSSVILDEESTQANDSGNNSAGHHSNAESNRGTPFYAVLQSGNPQTTLSSPKDKSKPP